MEYIDSIFGKYKSGVVQLITIGGLGIWTIIDLIIIANQKFKDSNGCYIKEKNNKNINVLNLICVIVICINIIILINGFKDIEKLKENRLYYNDIFDSIEGNIQVFLDMNATEIEEETLKNEIAKIDGVETIEYISKEMACKEMQEQVGNTITFEPEDFPASFCIKVSDLGKVKDVYNDILLLNNVKRVNNEYDTEQFYNNIQKVTNSYDILLIIAIVIRILFILGVIYVVIINNKIKKERVIKYK